MKRAVVLVVLLSISTLLHAGEVKTRPENWAKPLHADSLKNFHQLDAKVYRSAQPGRKGCRSLQQLGIRNVLNLRNYHSDSDEAKGLGMRLFRVKMEAGDIKVQDVVTALRIIRESEGPILIHCWHGSDRTGLISAMYRIVFQNWSKEDAIDELKNGGYGYHPMYGNIPAFIKDADIDQIKKQVFAP
jgi:protein tyrosine/serine phosphatase